MRLTRQHFRLVAGVLADARRDADTPEGVELVDGIAYRFATELAGTNPAFNRSTFIDAARGRP